jgi:hypothetical protein
MLDVQLQGNYLDGNLQYQSTALQTDTPDDQTSSHHTEIIRELYA